MKNIKMLDEKVGILKDEEMNNAVEKLISHVSLKEEDRVKKERIDIMVDLETFGVDDDAGIFQIAAVPFNIETEEIYIGEVFDKTIDFNSSSDFKANTRTLNFWMSNADTFKEITKKSTKGLTMKELIREFLMYLERLSCDKDLYLWGNGISFDNAKLKYRANLYGIRWSVKYNNDRDVRTYMDYAAGILNISQAELTGVLTDILNERHHDALHDVVAQIKKLFISKRIVENMDNVISSLLLENMKKNNYDVISNNKSMIINYIDLLKKKYNNEHISVILNQIEYVMLEMEDEYGWLYDLVVEGRMEELIDEIAAYDLFSETDNTIDIALNEFKKFHL